MSRKFLVKVLGEPARDRLVAAGTLLVIIYWNNRMASNEGYLFVQTFYRQNRKYIDGFARLADAAAILAKKITKLSSSNGLVDTLYFRCVQLAQKVALDPACLIAPSLSVFPFKRSSSTSTTHLQWYLVNDPGTNAFSKPFTGDKVLAVNSELVIDKESWRNAKASLL